MAWQAAAALAGLGALNAGTSIYGANKSASSAKQANKMSLLSQVMAQEWEKKKLQNSIQWTMEDAEKAGYNPILWAQQHGATSSGGAGPVVSGQQSQEGQIFAQGIQSAVAAAQNQMNIANNTQVANTQSAKNIADATKTMKEAGILNKTGEAKALAEIDNLNSQSAKNARDAQENYSNLGRIAQDISKGVKNKIQNLSNNNKTSAKKWKTFKDVLPSTAF